jgi:gamma-glutamylcyclotransferase (GGCT)/AIG2-like uncharacterized protein YtfP
MSGEENLFVYGTLRKDAVNEFASKLHASGQLLGSGRAKGSLYAIAEYPGLVPSESSSEWVEGEVYRLADPETMYRILDDYEGCGMHDPLPHEFRRVIMPILLNSGQWMPASVYVYTQDVSRKPKIETGSFLVNR